MENTFVTLTFLQLCHEKTLSASCSTMLFSSPRLFCSGPYHRNTDSAGSSGCFLFLPKQWVCRCFSTFLMLLFQILATSLWNRFVQWPSWRGSMCLLASGSQFHNSACSQSCTNPASTPFSSASSPRGIAPGKEYGFRNYGIRMDIRKKIIHC